MFSFVGKNGSKQSPGRSEESPSASGRPHVERTRTKQNNFLLRPQQSDLQKSQSESDDGKVVAASAIFRRTWLVMSVVRDYLLMLGTILSYMGNVN